MVSLCGFDCWTCGFTSLLVCGNVIRCVRLALSRVTQAELAGVSLPISSLARPFKISHGPGLRCWTTFWTDRSAARRCVAQCCLCTKRTAHTSNGGLLADNSKSKFGRRRPYMIVGSFFCVFAMLLLGYTRAFANIFSSSGSTFVSLWVHSDCVCSARLTRQQNDALTIWLAVFAIYCMDFAINAGSRNSLDRCLTCTSCHASAGSRPCIAGRHPTRIRAGERKRMGCADAWHRRRRRLLLVSVRHFMILQELNLVQRRSRPYRGLRLDWRDAAEDPDCDRQSPPDWHTRNDCGAREGARACVNQVGCCVPLVIMACLHRWIVVSPQRASRKK
jgi:hypothetical protein